MAEATGARQSRCHHGSVDGLLGGLYAISAVVALWASGVEIGIDHPVRELLTPLRRRGLVARVVLVDVLVLPLLVWALVKLFQVPAGYATGLLLVGVASAGPFGVKASQLARADAVLALSLVVTLELANLAAIPFWSTVVLPSGAGIDMANALVTLVAVVLLPLAGGLACRRLAPAFSVRLSPALPAVANVGLVVAVGAVLVRDGDVVVRAAGQLVPLVAGLAVLAALALGWLAGGPGRATRSAAALVTGIRANLLALAIAASSFPDDPDVRAGVVVFALFSITVPLVAALALGRRSEAGIPAVATFIPMA